MLKKLAILALLFGVIPQKHVYAGQPASRAAQEQKPANPTASPVVEKHGGSALQQGTTANQNTREPKSVRVILPPKDKYDLWAFGISVVLAGVGIAGIAVGICTLRFLAQQERLASRQHRVFQK